MKMPIWNQSVLLKLAFGLLMVAMLTGIGACAGPRIEATPGKFIPHTEGTTNANRDLIVFVHGFTGDRDKTWTYSDENGSIYWPQLVTLDPALKSFDVYVASYFTKALKPGKTIHELASDLNFDLKQHGVFVKYDKVFFVGHSMGNLVIREAMLDETIYGAVGAVRVPLIISFGAPSHGSELARICASFLSNQQCQDLIPEDKNPGLQSTNDNWRRMYPYTEIASAYETLESAGVGGRVVDRGGATGFYTPSRMPPKAIGANHSGMVKPKGLDDEIHVWLRQQLLAKPGLVAPYRVVLVDSCAPGLIYDPKTAAEGIRNMHLIQQALPLSQFPFVFHKLPVHDKWHNYDEVVTEKPDLVIIHFSSLYGETSLGDPKDRLRNFLLSVLGNSKAKIIVYSRWDENYLLSDGTKLGPMQEFLLKKLGKEEMQYQRRVVAFDINALGLPSPDWSEPKVIDTLQSKVRETLDLPGS